jgi:DNA polymerase-1
MIVVRDLLKAAGICVLQKAGVDADDAIAALACIPNRSVLIVSNDKDFLQLVGPSCSVIRNRGEGPELWDTQRVQQHYGLEPSQIADFLALCGDTVDGIPGLQGCGPKNATEMLQEWGTLRAIIENRSKLPERWRNAVNKQRRELRTFYKLTLLDTSVISANAMQHIIPRLTPGNYTSDLRTICEANGLVWLTKWFAAHRPCVNTRKQGLWA